MKVDVSLNMGRASTSAHDSRSKKRSPCPSRTFTSYSCKVFSMVVICILLLIAAGVLLYFLLFPRTSGHINLPPALAEKSNWTPHCPEGEIPSTERFDCFPEKREIDQKSCELRGCCFIEFRNTSGPSCIFPKNYGYEASRGTVVTPNGFDVPLKRLSSPSRYGDDIQNLQVKIEMQTKYRLRIKFYDADSIRYEVPTPKVPFHDSSPITDQNEREVFQYSVTYDMHNKPFTIKVRRSSTDTIIFDTSAGALIYANQFLELTTKVPSFLVYGWHQNGQSSLFNIFNWNTIPLFSRKPKGKISSGVHPMYMCLESDGNAHGVLLLNSNAMEVLMHPAPAVTYRTIGGILDFYLFLGPTPEDVIQQYTEAIGRPSLPPYWSLGFHVDISSYDSIDSMEEYIHRLNSKHIPVESFVVSQGVISKFMPEVEKFENFTNFHSKLKSRNQKIILQIEAGIAKREILNRGSVFQGNLQKEFFITDKWGMDPIVGKFNGKPVLYPDFGSPVISQSSDSWWSETLRRISSIVAFDGLWLIHNEPTSDIDGSVNGCLMDDLNQPPYIPFSLKNPLYQDTLCLDALLQGKQVAHYDYHNLYGHSMIVATSQALNFNHPTRRKLIMSDSSFVGSGHISGQCIKGLNSSWSGLQSSIPAVIKFGYHGIALSGVSASQDVRSKKESDALRVKWLQLAAFYPFLQLQASDLTYLYQAGLSDREIFRSIRNALSRRYELLPQLYTLFYLAHIKGNTIIRPLFHEYPNDNKTYETGSQFMWGNSLLISPILEENAKKLSFYLPLGVWYDFYQGTLLYSGGEWFTESGGSLIDSKQPVAMHLRAGHIITIQKPSETITLSRQNSMSIIIALNATYEANGFLYWDDGETRNSLALGEYLIVDYTVSNSTLVVSGKPGKRTSRSSFFRAAVEQVRIMGLARPPKRIIIDDSYILSGKQYKWNIDTFVLDLKLILIPLERRTEIKWYF